MEKTLIILKPDAVSKGRVGSVINRLEQAGYEIVAAKLQRLSSAKLAEHYAHVADKPFYPSIEQFMQSGPVLIMVLKGAGVVDRVRLLVGPTDSQKAPAGTIRGDWGTDKMMNIIHASDSVDAAASEIARFFAPDEVLG